MNGAATILNAAIRTELAPVLRADGFAGTSRRYRRLRSELIHIVSIQGSQSGGRFAVNLAVHLTFVPDERGFVVDSTGIDESVCALRRRMSETGADQWWSYEKNKESILTAVRTAKQVYLTNGRAQLEHFGNYPECFSHITPDTLESGEADLGGFGNTLPGLALLFARMRQYQKEPIIARRFAELGLLKVGRSILLVEAFQNILRQT